MKVSNQFINIITIVAILSYHLQDINAILHSKKNQQKWYVETVPNRYSYQGNKETLPSTWPIFPTIGSADDVITVQGQSLILSDGNFYFGESFEKVLIEGTSSGISFSGNGTKIENVDDENGVIVASTPTETCILLCAFSEKTSTCTINNCAKIELGIVYAIASSKDMVENLYNLWIGSDAGLMKFTVNNDYKIVKVSENLLDAKDPILSVEVSGNYNSKEIKHASGSSNVPIVIAGNSEKLWYVDYKENFVRRWEWVTDVATSSGGIIDDVITSMAFVPVSFMSTITNTNNPNSLLQYDIFIGNLASINIMYLNGSVYTINGDHGLPYNNITSVAYSTIYAPSTDITEPTLQVWIGTKKGLILWQRKHNDPEWKYFMGPRWLAGSNIKSMTILPRANPSANVGDHVGDTIVIVAEDGITFLEQRKWTLEMKASVYEKILNERHDRLGMTSGCNFKNFGDTSVCIESDDDNNGLWTSLVVVAEYMRYAVTKDPEALLTASKFFNGIVLLNEVTGTTGLMGRSCCSPDEWEKKTCGYHTWIHDKEHWHNSTNPNYQGYRWKGDTSSDEVTGHVFALSTVAHLSPNVTEQNLAKKLLNNIVMQIVNNNFNLIDVTGQPTTWGRWGPEMVNNFRGFSDERGLQSLQILAYITSTFHVGGLNATSKEILKNAYDILTNQTNQYDENVRNLKITVPCDDNYSDDELAYLPFFTFLNLCKNKESCIFNREPIVDGLTRLSKIVQIERPSLWNAIYLGMINNNNSNNTSSKMKSYDDDNDNNNNILLQSLSSPSESGSNINEKERINDILWNLQTWPQELIDWPVSNSHRIDIIYDLSKTTRFHKSHIESIKTRAPLPANERCQYRWNANPYIIQDCGSGMSESDPGAWLLPYWMARYYDLI